MKPPTNQIDPDTELVEEFLEHHPEYNDPTKTSYRRFVTELTRYAKQKQQENQPNDDNETN